MRSKYTTKYTVNRRINILKTADELPIIFDSPPTLIKRTNLYHGEISGNDVMVSWTSQNGCLLYAIDENQLERSHKKALDRLIEN